MFDLSARCRLDVKSVQRRGAAWSLLGGEPLVDALATTREAKRAVLRTLSRGERDSIGPSQEGLHGP